jgi:hypothetical protein
VSLGSPSPLAGEGWVRLGGVGLGPAAVQGRRAGYVATSPCLMLSVIVSSSLPLVSREREDEEEGQHCDHRIQAVRIAQTNVLQGREGCRYQEVGQPLRGRAQPQRRRPNPIRKHLAQQYPHHRPPGHAEEEHIDVGRNLRD